MVRVEDTEIIDKFEQFYRNFYDSEIGQLAQKYPNEKRSLYIEWDDLYRFDPDIADDFVAQPGQMRSYAEEALRLYDLPVDVKLGQAHVRVRGLPQATSIREIRARHRGQLVEVTGNIRKATDVRLGISEAAFECQRCGTLTRIPQTAGEFYEPHECQGCERQGPFEIYFDQSEFIEKQQIQLFENPAELSSGTQPNSIEIQVKDDITGKVVPGDRVQVTGVLHLQQENNDQSTNTFEPYITAVSIRNLDEGHSAEYQSVPDAVTDLETYTDLASIALTTLPDDVREEETKAKLITPFIEALGWNKFNGNEVRLEYTDSKTSLRPDYMLFGPEGPAVVVEAKQIGTPLQEQESQLNNYLRVFDADWGILTNGERFHIFTQRNNSLPEKIAELKLSDLSDTRILDSIHRDTIYD